jgi:hypothetical protein
VARAQVILLPQLQSAALSPLLGVLSNFSGFTTALAGVEGAVRSERFGPQLALALEADYGFRSRSESAAGLFATSHIDLLLSHATAQFRQRFGPTTAFAGAGPSLAFYWTRLAVAGAPQMRGFAVAPGLSLAVGAERRMGFAVPFMAARATWIDGTQLAELRGPLRALSFTAGVRLEMW